MNSALSKAFNTEAGERALAAATVILMLAGGVIALCMLGVLTIALSA